MHRPVKRGFLPSDLNDLQHGRSNEAQCNINVLKPKRQRQRLCNVVACPEPLSDPQTILFSNPSGYPDPQSAFTAPQNRVLDHDEVTWEYELHNAILSQPLSYLGSGCFDLPEAQSASVSDPNFIRADPVTDQPIFQMQTEASHQFRTSAQRLPHDARSEALASLDLRGSLLSHDHNSTVASLFSGGWDPPTNHSDWINALLDEAANSPCEGDAAPLADASFYESTMYVDGGVEAGAIIQSNTSPPCAQLERCIAPRITNYDDVNSRFRFQQPKKPKRKLLPLYREEDYKEPTVGASKHISANRKPLKPDGRPKLGRSKPLGSEAAKQAAEMRIIKVCLPCSVMKIGCSPGETCGPCQTSHMYRGPCIRFDLANFAGLFFPSLVNSSFEDSTVDKMLRENVTPGFGARQVLVEVSSGPTYRPISLLVDEFQPSNEEFLALSHIKSNENGVPGSDFIRRYSPPFALSQSATGKALREKCQEHVELIAEGPRGEGELFYKDTSIVSWEIFNAIGRYRKSANVRNAVQAETKNQKNNWVKEKIVRDAMELFAMHYFMTQILVLTDDSAGAVMKCLSRPTRLPYTCNLTSKLLGLQIKQEMFILIREATTNLLSDLRRTMSNVDNSTRTAWGCSFCAISILCMCLEMVQSATDLKIVHLMRQEGYTRLTRADSENQSRELPLFYCIEMFHLAFRSHKRSGSRKYEHGFNPIKHGLNVDNQGGMSQPEAELINEIRQVISKHEKEIEERMQEPPIDYDPSDLSDLLDRHLSFRERNSGKMVSRFLHSFFRSSS